jgi:hypothetical protein
MYSVRRTAALPAVGFPIRTSSDQSLVSGSPGLFAATHVLLRLLSPRHPSCALCSLVISLLRPSSGLQRQRPGSSAVRLISPRPSPQHTLPTCAYAVFKERGVVGLGRFELPTPRLSSVCSNQLSYRPDRRRFKERAARPVSQNQTGSPRKCRDCAHRLT